LIIGNKEKFAIELEIMDEPLDKWISCRFYFWINNMLVGDSERELYVNDILILMYATARDANDRHHNTLFELNKVELYERLNNTFFGPIDSGFEKMANDEAWARFIVNPIEWHIYIIENDLVGRLLFRNTINSEINEIELEQGEFDKVYGEMYRYLDDFFSRVREEGAI